MTSEQDICRYNRVYENYIDTSVSQVSQPSPVSAAGNDWVPMLEGGLGRESAYFDWPIRQLVHEVHTESFVDISSRFACVNLRGVFVRDPYHNDGA